MQLAVQGKLVEQRPEEGTAKELLEQIKVEKEQLIKDKKIKKEKPLPEISEEEIPFEIPESWEWAYVGDIFLHNTGKAQNSSDLKNGTIRKFITTSNLYWNEFDFSKIKEMYFTDKELERCTVKKGDLLVCEGGDCGRSAIWTYNEEVCIQNHVHRLRPYISVNVKYFYYLFYLYKFTGRLRGRGVGIQGLSNEAIHKVVCPLPPLEEQKRIVAKIEEILPYIEQYDKAYTKLETFNKKFPEDMKKSILQLAMQGKLVEQRPEEGTAEELYKQIVAEKARLIKEGKIKKEKPFDEIIDEEIPFEIPESWKWVRLGWISTYGQTKQKINAHNIKGDMWALDLEDIEKGTGNIIKKVYASERKITGDKVLFKKGNILYSKLRPYLLKILIADDDGICTPELVPFDVYNIDVTYVMWVLKSPHIDFIVNSVSYGVKMPRVGTETMLNLLIPLPPLAEQKRIVSKLEQLLPYCNQLIK